MSLKTLGVSGLLAAALAVTRRRPVLLAPETSNEESILNHGSE